MSDLRVFEREDGKWDWKLVSRNGEEMCGSLQGYESASDAEDGFWRCQEAIKAGVSLTRVPRA